MKPAHYCYFLENKAFHMPPPPDGRERDDVVSPSWLPFTCLKTHEVFGPDGEDACPEGCVPTRACYKPEVEL